MTFECITATREDAALVVRFNRPEKRNALSLRTMDEIGEALTSAEADPQIRTLIITGGDRFFSAGADLNEALEVKTLADGDKFFGRANRLFARLEASRLPVIAAIEGFCITGGCELAMACDIRIGAHGSTYAITSSRIGTVAGFGGTQRLPRIVGSGNALEMLFTADPIDAERALRIGLLNRLVEKGTALEEAKRMAHTLEQRGPISLAFAKQAVHRGMQLDQQAGIELEYLLVNSIYTTDDKREGISAFLEKRTATFTGT